MAIRVEFELSLNISENSSGLKELGNTPPWKGKNDLLDDGGSFKRTLAGNATDVLISLEGLAVARLIGIKSNKIITVKKNSSAGEAWTIRPLGTGALDGVLIMTTDTISSLYLSNTEADAASVVIFFAGTV
jgi:hypothetical protein